MLDFATWTSHRFTALCAMPSLCATQRTVPRTLTVLALLILPWMVATSPATAGSDLTLRVNDVKAAPGELIAVEVRTYAPRGVGQGQICLRAASRLNSSGSGSLAGTATPGSFDAGLLDAAVDATDGLQAWRSASTGRDLTTGETGEPTGLRVRSQTATDLPARRPLMTLEGVVVLSALGDAVSGSLFDAGTQMTLVDFASDSASINNADGPMVVLYYRLDEDLQPDQEFELRIEADDTFIVDPFGNPMTLEFKPGRLRIENRPGGGCSY